jgi:TolB-like protein
MRARGGLCILLFAAVVFSSAHAQADSAPPATKHVLVTPFTAIGVDPQLATSLPQLVSAELARHHGYDAVSSDQLAKQQSSCAQDETCLKELGRKLHADLVLTGSVGQVGAAYVLALSLADPKSRGAAARVTETARAAKELPALIPKGLAQLLEPSTAPPAFHLAKGRKSSFAVFDLRPSGLTPQIVQNLTQVLSTEVKGVEGASVISRADIAAMLQLDQAKMLAGCDDESCTATLGGALGVDHMITGDAGKVGDLYVINLQLIDVRRSAVENRVTETYSGTEEELLRAVRKAGRDLLGLESQDKGALTVTASQNNAVAYIDEGSARQTPVRIVDLTPAKHAVRVTSAGYFDWHGDVYVDPLETTATWAELKKRPQEWYQKWWLWTGIGVVVVGGVTAALLATRPAPAAVITIHAPVLQ